jgi:hypothetical protein
MLSLVALIFMALSSGMIIFQVINKYIIDILDQYNGMFSQETLKFAISALIISTPIYYLTAWQIQKSLFKGTLEKDSGVRRWLTYFILFVSSVVMIGWLIATINSFLDGELTTKFILKSLTAILISGVIFSFYLYEIKREEIVQKKDKVVRAYFVVTLFFVIACFVTSLLIVESPTQTRNRKMDNNTISNLSQIESEVNNYYAKNKKLPQNFEELKKNNDYLADEMFKDKLTGNFYEYKITDTKNYELCADFLMNSKDDKNISLNNYWGNMWKHEAGRQCFKKDASVLDEKSPLLID